MIDFVRGAVIHMEADYVVLDVQGIGYRIYTPNPYVFANSEAAVTVYTHHHVREDAMLLFGFVTRQEQKLFRRLIEVSGVGPKVALGILSAGRPDSVVMAIQQENYPFLTKLPGIGKKTAQRIVLDLKDRLDGIGVDFDPGSLFTEVQMIEGDQEDSVWHEARAALKALGYKDVELDQAWNVLQHRVHTDETVDAMMKKALQLLFTG